jgi:hypothetical protein
MVFHQSAADITAVSDKQLWHTIAVLHCMYVFAAGASQCLGSLLGPRHSPRPGKQRDAAGVTQMQHVFTLLLPQFAAECWAVSDL